MAPANSMTATLLQSLAEHRHRLQRDRRAFVTRMTRAVHRATAIGVGWRALAMTAWAFMALPVAMPVSAMTPLAAQPDVLTAALQGQRVIFLGEVHDNAVQHALRIEVLRRLVAAGERPAIAFEQFDRERQSDIDRARRERPRDAGYLIEQGGGAKTWRWEFYRPFVQLALDFDLPIVAANLSRKDAMKLSTEGWSVLFDAAAIEKLGIERLPAEIRAAHQREIQRGHCDLIPAGDLPAMARAQIGRDLVLAQSIRPYLAQGVVLLTGNGHVRKDIGVPAWLTAEELSHAISVGMLEEGELDAPDTLALRFDLYVVTAAADRPDQCAELRKRFAAGAGR